jgi:glycosyltransferase involved in cell wall biosynthesis
VATTASPLPGLLAGGGFFVAPGDVDALTEGLWRLTTDAEAQTRMGAAARDAAARLTWQGAARAAIAAIEDTAR